MAGVVANIFLAIGVTLLIVPYLYTRSIQFLLPQNYYYPLVINDVGILLWEYRYQKHLQMESVLFSPFVGVQVSETSTDGKRFI